MSALLWTHIAGGLVAVLAGYVALLARKGTPLHVGFGRVFAGAMLVLGVSAAILEPFREPKPGSFLVGFIVVYLVTTAWSAAYRRDNRGARFEGWAMRIAYVAIAASVALGIAALLGVENRLVGDSAGRNFSGLGLWAFAVWRDARYRRLGVPNFEQRRLRHAWRICLAMFVATGSFFLGQQDVLPAMLRGTVWQWALAFAPLAYLAAWRLWPRNARGDSTRAVIAPGTAPGA
jgi:uncharacterized membrane protein